MKFFNIDLHISVIADIKKIFTDLGHEVTDLCLSGHNWVMNRKKDYVSELSNDKWTRLVWDWNFDEFYEAHKHSLKDFDGFICTYPPIFAMLYERFNKPIIIDVPIRYDYSVHGCPERLGKWNAWLEQGVKSGQVKLIANNKYDVEYCKILSGLEPIHIPNLCEYFPRRSTCPRRGGFVLYELGNTLTKHFPDIRDRSVALPAGWKWSALDSFNAIVHLPYQVSTMSLFEQYTANIPQLFPTKRLLEEMYFTEGWNVLSQVSNYKMSNKKPTKTVIPIRGDVDPNDWTDKKTVAFWLKYADFYDEYLMPDIIYFDNGKELVDLCKNTDFEKVTKRMVETNKYRKELAYSRWKEVLNEIKS
jgi:hypothetical protein